MNSIWMTVIAALAALAGALGSQWIAARGNMKSRRLELFFRAKADTYQRLMEQIGIFALDPQDQGKYLLFLGAFESALVFSSDEVADALAGKTGINANAQRLRMAESADDHERVRFTMWIDAVKALTAAMREDLKRLSGGMQ